MPMAAAPQTHREEPFVRPAMRLAILSTDKHPLERGGVQPIGIYLFRLHRVLARYRRKEKFSGSRTLAIEDQPAFRPRLVSSVSSFPRQEVRGGFPVDLKTEVRPDADTPSAGPVAVPSAILQSSGTYRLKRLH